VEKASITFKK